MKTNQVILSDEERIVNYKLKKIKKQIQNNAKSHKGFGYEYKPFQFNLDVKDLSGHVLNFIPERVKRGVEFHWRCVWFTLKV